MKERSGGNWHHLDRDQVVALLESDSERGLRADEIAGRRDRFGPNELTSRRGPGPVVRFLMQFHAPLVYVLLAAVVVTALLGEWVESGVIMAVVLVNAVIGFLQESKAIEAIEALARRMASEALVVRDGEPTRVPAQGLVPGDIVLLESGDQVPADLRLLATRELRVDESALTGESVGSQKDTLPTAAEAALPDRTSMAYSSTFVTTGRGRGIVVEIGNRSEIGRISRMLEGVEQLRTPLTRKIAAFSRLLLIVILALGAGAFALGTARGEPLVDVFMASVALAVGAIPEGLPAAVTVILAIGVARMARKNALIRRLPAVETLGSTTIICSDKTGTLTQNQMTVQRIATASGTYAVEGTGYDPAGSIASDDGAAPPDASSALRECLRGGLLCNDARLFRTEGGWSIQGDPTEGALVVAAHKAGLTSSVRDELPRLDALPFESEHQYMATLHDQGDDRERVVYVKGSIERVLARCVDALDANGERVALDKSAIERASDQMTTGALRVLAIARARRPAGTTSLDRSDVEGGLTFLGLEGMIDPPRPEAIEAVHVCRGAGVDVKMITGDHAKTAEAIAELIGIGRGHGRIRVITGNELAAMSDAELTTRLPSTDVFARVAPEHKLRIVTALQAAGHVVAMTGDGVNDAPALKRADIGVAMGASGTDVAKGASDMVLTDDNFASIAAAVEEGRGVFDNLRKFIVWTIPTNVGEGLAILSALALGVALPIMPLQILWINMTTAILLGMTLAFEPREKDIMLRPPRAPTRPLLTMSLLKRTGLVSLFLVGGAFGLFELETARGASLEAARTVATNVFIVVEAFYLLSCRSLLRSPMAVGLGANRWVWLGMATMAVFQLVFTYAPPMNALFGSAPIGALEWLKIFGVGALAFAAVEIEKAVRRRSKRLGRTTTERPLPAT
jgi:cation-transporting P-type ATPase F